MTVTATQIPPIWCPIEPRTHPGAATFEERSRLWLAEFNMDERSLRRAAATSTGMLASSWAPDGDDEGVQLLSDWLVWALLFDDHYCDAGQMAAQPVEFNPLVARLMHHALYPEHHLPGDPVFEAFRATLVDLMRRIQARADPQLSHLCSLAHFIWAMAAACGVSDRSGNTVRSLDEHLIIRPPDGSYLLSIYMTEVAEGTALPAHERVSPHVRALTEAAGILLTVPTDLASYAHEEQQQSLESNVVHILSLEHSCSTQEAVDMACSLLELVMGFFVAMRDQLARTASAELRTYLKHLSNIVRGTLDWQRTLPRYTTTLDVALDGPAQAVTQPVAPIHDICETPRYERRNPPASIAWWWDLLA
jgi:hypothetical protein